MPESGGWLRCRIRSQRCRILFCWLLRVLTFRPPLREDRNRQKRASMNPVNWLIWQIVQIVQIVQIARTLRS